MTRFAEQRREFSAELRGMAETYGDAIDEGGSAAAAVHRGWIALKDALTGADPKPVLRAALQGEEHAISEYEKALEEDLSPSLRTVVAANSIRSEARGTRSRHWPSAEQAGRKPTVARRGAGSPGPVPSAERSGHVARP